MWVRRDRQKELLTRYLMTKDSVASITEQFGVTREYMYLLAKRRGIPTRRNLKEEVKNLSPLELSQYLDLENDDV
jgi:hypothetical protein